MRARVEKVDVLGWNKSDISSGSTSGGSHIPRKLSESFLHTLLFWLFLEKKSPSTVTSSSE